MESYKIVIASLNRPKEIVKKTLKTLQRYKISSDRVIIFVHNEEQKTLYEEQIEKDLYSEIINANQEKGLHNMRNFISDYFPENQYLVSMDDDVLGIYETDGKKLKEIEDFESLIRKGFSLCVTNNFTLWGLYPVANAFYMKSKEEYSRDLRFIVGGFFGQINKKRKLSLEIKEDYERTLQCFKEDNGVIRFNNICVKHTIFSKSGGISKNKEERMSESKRAIEILSERYPGLLCEKKNNEGEISLKREAKKKNKI
jgi:hypothetical protein